MYNMLGQVKVGGEFGLAFEVLQGLKQGDGLAPILFTLALESVVRRNNTITSILFIL